MSGSGGSASYSDCPVTQFMADDDAVPAQPTLTYPQLRSGVGPGLAGLLRPAPFPPSSPARTPAQPCPTCTVPNTRFYCDSCVISGDFVHSSSALCERFSEKQLRLFSLQRDISVSKAEVEREAGAAWTRLTMQEDIKITRTKIKYLKHCIRQQQERRQQTRQVLARHLESNNKRHLRLPQFADKAQRMEKFVAQFRADTAGVRAGAGVARAGLRAAQSRWVAQIHDWIFPIAEVEAGPGGGAGHTPQSSSPQADQMVEFLADAIQTSYVGGRWVRSETGAQFAILGVELSHYALLAADCGMQHSGAAALSLTAQLTALLASALGLPLPARLQHADFGSLDSSGPRFDRKVSRLNSVVARLCLEFLPDSSAILPAHPLHNLRLLVESLRGREPDGSPGPRVELSEAALENWERQLAGPAGSDSEESDSEKGPAEWETVCSGGAVVETEQAGPASALLSSTVSTVSHLLWGSPHTKNT